MSALEKYREAMLYALASDNRYHIDPRTAIEKADAAIAELEAELERERQKRCGTCGKYHERTAKTNAYCEHGVETWSSPSQDPPPDFGCTEWEAKP